MTRYAVLEGATVRAVHDVELIDGVPNLSAQGGDGQTVLVPLAEAYPAAWTSAPCPDAVQPGWTLAAGVFAAPALPQQTGQSLATQLAAYAEAKQAALIAGGYAFNVAPAGQPAEIVQADTDVSGRLNLAGLVSLAQINPNLTSIWVQAGGGLMLTAAEIIALGVAVGTFVVQTYQALATVLAGIASGAITTTAQIDAAGWPAAQG